MKKKILSIFLCIFLLLFCACSNKMTSNVIENQSLPKQKVIKFASITGTNEDMYEYKAGLIFKDKVEEYSNGTLKVEYYPASQLGNSTETVESVSLGTIEAAMSIGFDIYANLDPMLNVVGLPYLFKDYNHLKAFLENEDSPVNELKQSLIKNAGIRILGYNYRPMRSIVMKKKIIESSEGLYGLTIRSPESTANIKWLESMGANPVTITWSELFTSLQTGAVDGAENSITEFYAGNFQDVIKSATETNHMSVTTLLTINEKFYNSLTEEEKNAVNKAANDSTSFTWDEFQIASEKAWDAFEEAGVTCIRNKDINQEDFRKKGENVYKYFIDKGDFSEDLYNKILNYNY